jgi:hypothetical protein
MGMDSVRFYGMSVLDMEFLKQWSGLDFDISEAIGYAFTMSSEKGAEDCRKAIQANRLWCETGRSFPISMADRVFPPKARRSPSSPL